MLPGQSEERYLDGSFAVLRRPYGAGGGWWGAFPTLKRGANLLSIPGRWFTKQTGDMVYTFAENGWLSQLWLAA